MSDTNGKLKRPQTERSREDLMDALREQLGFLRVSCKAFDYGNMSEAKRIAGVLKILLYEAGGARADRSRALLQQIGALSGNFYNTASPIVPNNLASSYSLLIMGMNGRLTRFFPKVWALRSSATVPYWSDFTTWWTQPVIKDTSRAVFTRYSLIADIRDKDGGGHVDGMLPSDYFAMSRGDTSGWITVGGAQSKIADRPHLLCMRQMAHEVFITLSDRFPELGDCARPVEAPQMV